MVAVYFLDMLRHRVQHVHIESMKLVGPVQHELRDMAINAEVDVFTHVCSLCSGCIKTATQCRCWSAAG